MVGFVSWTSARTNNDTGNGSGPSHKGGSSQHGFANGHAGSSGTNGQYSKHNSNGHAQGSHGQGSGFGSTPNAQYQYPFEDSPPNGSTRVPTPEPYTEDSPTGHKNTSWEKAKEETRRKEQERKRQEDLKKQQDEDKRKKDAAERETKAAAEKERWEQLRAREKENRERVLREKQARERMSKSTGDCPEQEDRDRADRDARLKAAADRAERLRADRADKDGYGRAKSEKAMPTFGVGERLDPYAKGSPSDQRKSGRPYQQPTAQTYVGTATETGFRPYETSPRTAPNGSYYAASEDSHPRTESTAPTSPSRSYAGPYSTKDPDKVMLQGAFEFNDNFPNAPIAGVRPGENKISDGLILIFGTEGIFLNDDRRDEKLRSWDVKAWTLTAIETAHKPNFTLVRVSVMSSEKTRYVYVVPTAEKWKVDVGLKRLKGGSLFKRSTTISVMSNADANKLTTLIGL